MKISEILVCRWHFCYGFKCKLITQNSDFLQSRPRCHVTPFIMNTLETLKKKKNLYFGNLFLKIWFSDLKTSFACGRQDERRKSLWMVPKTYFKNRKYVFELRLANEY